MSEINTQNVPILKGYQQFTLYSKKRFHGITVAVKNCYANNMIRIPHENSGLEIVHLLYRDAPVPINFVALYLDVESRLSAEEIKETQNKLKSLFDEILEKGEGICALGDLNRNIFTNTPSLGAKLLKSWIEEEGTEINDG